jgi:5,10-methylene-tetrahydrofolate dehydrogenase/methenyl tetrahydrofolate cyclohydrolase
MSSAPTLTRIVKGGPLRDRLLAQVAAAVLELHLPVRLCIVQVGNHGPSNVYIRQKLAACDKVGMEAHVVKLHESEGEAMLHTVLKRLGMDGAVHGIIVQAPLPSGWDVQAALNLVPAAKDIDGLSEASGALWRQDAAKALLPATPLGILRLLQAEGVEVAGTKIAVIGQGKVVGAPLGQMLRAAGAEVTIIDKDTVNPAKLARDCDVVISAAGVPGLVTDEWVKPGAAVIDGGLADVVIDLKRVNGKLVGDVARERVEGMAGMLTPVPGGVGPMTVASLITNLMDAACLQLGRPRMAWVIDGEGEA